MEFMLVPAEAGGWQIRWPGRIAPCAIGEGGIKRDKREGDGATPSGRWPLRAVLYRPDRVQRPATALPVRALTPEDGWCDDPADPAYNRRITRPYGTRHEALWRDDAIYDLIVPLGYNDDPPIAGRGSAIFLHIARADYSGTAGCIALARGDLEALLRAAAPGDVLIIP